MQATRKNLTFGMLVVVAIAALFAVAGHPLIDPAVLTGLGIMPLAIGETSFGDIKTILENQGKDFQSWKSKQDAKFDELKDYAESLEVKLNRQGLGNIGSSASGKSVPAFETWVDTKSQKSVPVLGHSQDMGSLEAKADTPTMGRVLRGLVLGGRAGDARQLEEERKAMSIGSDPAGGYTVSGRLASEWIDLLRSNMVLSKAGARTVPMDSATLTLARVTGDPTVAWHAENASLTDGDLTLGAVSLTARTVVCLVKLSLELSQDSANIEQILQSTITSAMASAIDSAGISGVAPEPGGVANLSGRNTVATIGAPTNWDFLTDGMYQLMADNVPMDRIGALVAHPALWKKMRKLKTGITNDNTPLTMPAEIAALPKLWTTAAPLTGGNTATGIIGDWRDLLFGVRKDITVRVLQETFMGSNLQIAVLAYARVDFAATRAASFCTLEGITV